MKSYFATYRATSGAHPVESTVLVFDKNLSIGIRNPDGTSTMVNWLIKDVESGFEFSLQQTRLRHTSSAGAELLINGNDADRFIKDRQAEFKKPWHKQSRGREWIRNSILVLCLLAGLFLLYLLMVPWLSQKLATKVSIKTEKVLGDGVYNGLDLTQREDTVHSRLLNEFFSAMQVSTPYDVRISVVEDEIVNAFALPGGRIVVYSALLDEINTYPELAALLSHEFTHINNKHSTKSIFRKLGSKVFLGLLFGKIGSVTNVVIDHADELRSLTYSRKLEREADLEGLAILLKRGIDPRGFQDLFHHLEKAAVSNVPEFLASHPDVDNRIRYIHEASKGAPVKDNPELKAIFERLK
jgi:Zn-dependent protease with chaperone function